MEEKTKEEEVGLEHGMFAVERQEDFVAIIIGIIIVIIALLYY